MVASNIARRLLGLLISISPATASADADADAVRDVEAHQPLELEDAVPSPRGVHLAMTTLAGEVGDREGLFARPAMHLGAAPALSFYIATVFAIEDGSHVEGPLDIGAHWMFREESPHMSAFAATVTAVTAYPDLDAATELGLAATKTVGDVRVHVNGRYVLEREAEDHYLFGGAADVLVGDRVLILADAFYAAASDTDRSLGVELAVQVRLGHVLMQSSAGLIDHRPDTGARILAGIVTDL